MSLRLLVICFETECEILGKVKELQAIEKSICGEWNMSEDDD